MVKLSTLFYYAVTQLIYRTKFSRIGHRTIIYKPLNITEAGSIFIGNKTVIGDYSWLMGNKESGQCTLSIGNGVAIGHFAHIIAKRNVVIEDDVLIADKVYITDCNHNYEDVAQPIIKQGICHIGDVRIGEGSWLGEHVCVLGAKIGKHCVIGANAVVTKDIPDYSVAVGVPARVIKRFDFSKRRWVGVRNEDSVLGVYRNGIK